VNRDLILLTQQAIENIRKYVDESLPEEYEKWMLSMTNKNEGKDDNFRGFLMCLLAGTIV
jgi:hypothetical protein